MMYSDIKKDADYLLNSFASGEQQVPNALDAMKLSAAFPVTCLSLYALSFAYIIYSFVPPDDVWINPTLHYQGLTLAFGGFTLILSLAIMAMTYTPFLLLTAIPQTVRSKSLLVQKLSRTYKNTCIAAIFGNGIFALIAAWNPQLFYAAPFMLLISHLIMQAIISSELTRYGIAGAMSKFAKIIKNI
ncbi:hypothetical protein [Pantoea agglomerans]|uniref:hypothetical protein n=1 Tax=Enterobacter agglomerans TaxID=549 RepID=UPI001009688B|nr:hypothetical protein [Pantoea agglomerans]QAV47700.1 hypothetical protein D1629_24115 [Pantoea agglomerans]QAV52411.1 hypothetical protein D1628_24385 [Pantoea agglomerans]